jgi:hypothetical protein
LEHRPGLAATAVLTSGIFGHGLAELDGPEAALIRVADAALDSRIVVLVPGALELTCALMRQSYTNVAIARLTDRPRAEQADVLIVPEIAPGITADGLLDRVVSYARRVLAPLGTVVLSLDAGLPAVVAQQARCRLRTLGFAAVHAETACGSTLVRADLPLVGRLS